MKKSLKKSLMILLSIIMVITMAMPAVFAEETADVAITFAVAAMENSSADGGLVVTNMSNSASGRETVEGWYIGNKIVFNFDTDMNTETLNPQNIKIYLGSAYGIATAEANFDKTTMEWSYTNYEATSRSYTIYISEMCEGVQQHKVTFTSNVKTADDVAITEVVKNFKTGRIAKFAPAENRQIVDVAYGKKFYKEDGTEVTKWTNYQASYLTDDRAFASNGKYYKIDLGNYYNIEDVVIYSWRSMAWAWNQSISAAYSNDPDATFATATSFGSFAKNQYMTSTDANSNNDAANQGGRGVTRWLHPSGSVRARYIFIKATSGDYGEPINEIKILANLDTDYGAITATKSDETVTEFSGAGEYVVSVPVTEYVLGSSNGYMIVAGYDANGVITKINCAPVSKADGVLSLATTFTDTTKTLKAVLIKDFTQPQMLTDALVLETPAVQE